MPPKGPGMTHTCYQSPEWYSSYEKFKANGADILSRGDQPIDLGGYGVTYAYAYDAEGHMMEIRTNRKTKTNNGQYMVSNESYVDDTSSLDKSRS